MLDVMGYFFNLQIKIFLLWDNKFRTCEENIARVMSFCVRPRGGVSDRWCTGPHA